MMRKFIFETDWFTDCDDCVALRFLARNLDKEHELLGANVNAVSPYAYASIRAFLENEMGIPTAEEDPKGDENA